MFKMYGNCSNEYLDAWERSPRNARVLTSSTFGAWLLRRDERKREQETNTGHWIMLSVYNCHTTFKCSVCGYKRDFIHLLGKPSADYDYCPRCGARMEDKV